MSASRATGSQPPDRSDSTWSPVQRSSSDDLPAGADRLIVHSRGIEHIWVNGAAIRTDGKDVDDAHPGVLIRGGAT
jgi:hypothetical protein